MDPSRREIRKTSALDPAREDRLQETWSSVFTALELVTFEPYRPSPTNTMPFNRLTDPEGEMERAKQR